MVATDVAPGLNPDGAVWTLAVTYAIERPLKTARQFTTHVVIEASTETEARMLAAQMVETQVGNWWDRPHPEVVLSVEIIDCEV